MEINPLDLLCFTETLNKFGMQRRVGEGRDDPINKNAFDKVTQKETVIRAFFSWMSHSLSLCTCLNSSIVLFFTFYHVYGGLSLATFFFFFFFTHFLDKKKIKAHYKG
jgi:hypothetical protein